MLKQISTKILELMIVLSMLNNSASAGLETLIRNVMPKGTMSNVSKSTVVRDQLAGHMIGGSVMLKSPAPEELQLANIQAPKCNIGGLPCGAQFDLRAGAMSFVQSAEMVRFLKDMVANLGMYGAILAIKTICPQCEDVMTLVEAIQRDMSNFLKMDCQSVLSMSQGAFAKMTNAGIVNRQSNLVKTADKSDAAGIAQKSRDDVNDPTLSSQDLNDQLGDSFNLVWKALDKKATGGSTPGRSIKELLMSISGTIIINKEGSPVAVNLGSLVNNDLIEEYIGTAKGSGKIELYQCNEAIKCLNPKIEKITISASDTLYGQIDKLIASIVIKVKNNKSSFTEEEENLISLSSIGLINKIEMDLATHPDSAEANVRMAEFIEALCYDVITTHFTKMLQKTTLAVNELSYLQLTDTGVFEKFNSQASETLRIIMSAKSVALKRYDIITQARARMRQDESYFESKFEEYLSNNYLEG